jgi:hypothetical protein
MVARRIAGLIVAVLVALGAGTAPAGAGTASAIAACRTGPKLVDVYYRYYDDQVLNAEGRVVGLASGTARFELYRKGPSTFCAVSSLTGTFTLFGGESPAGTGTVPEGLRGHIVGVNVLEFTGTFNPQLPTRGYVGEFDANCDELDCETPIRFGRYYVETDGPPAVIDYRFVQYSTCGIWVDAFSYTEGDIAC